MTVGQLPEQVLEFARYLNGLVERLDRSGWCGVFWQRDPDGMRACLEGQEVPPWDVVEALLQDVLAQYGERAAAQETARAHTLYAASLAAYDVRPGAREALGDRLDVMLREQRYAAERQAELGGRLPSAVSRERPRRSAWTSPGLRTITHGPPPAAPNCATAWTTSSATPCGPVRGALRASRLRPPGAACGRHSRRTARTRRRGTCPKGTRREATGSTGVCPQGIRPEREVSGPAGGRARRAARRNPGPR